MPAFSPADSRDDDQQQRTRPPWLPDVVPGDGNDNSQGSDPDRLTLGARIGGAKTPLPIPPNRPAPEDRPPAPQPQIDLDPNKMPDIMKGVSTRMPPLAPVGSANPNLPGLLKQQAEYGKPIDKSATDPNTGKPLYKMGWGQRILGTAANFASGFGGRGPVAYVGPGATNWRYDRDEATRQANLANVGTQIKGQEALDTENLKLEREAQRQAYEGITGEARKTAADAQQSRADAYQQLADVRKQLADQAGNKGSKIQTDAEDRTRLADQLGLKGQERRDYILTGKTANELRAGSKGAGLKGKDLFRYQLWTKDHGREPATDAEFNDAMQGKSGIPADSGKFAAVQSKRNADWGKARREYEKAATEADGDKGLLADAQNDYYEKRQDAQDQYEQQIQTLGGGAEHVNLPRNHFDANGRLVARPDAEQQTPGLGTLSGVANQSPNRGAPVKVADPRGVVHTFPDQKSADAFKKAARIR